MIGGAFRDGFGATPVAGAVAVTNVTVDQIATTSVRISWNTSVPTQGQVEYSTDTSYNLETAAELSYLYGPAPNGHVQSLANLSPGTTYNFRLVGQSATGVTYSASGFTFTTAGTSAPDILISDVVATVHEDSTVTWSWSASPASTGQVEYELDPLSLPYGNSTTLETGLLPAHVQGPYGPLAAGTWHYRILATTPSASEASPDFTFVVTSGFPPPPPPPPTGRTPVMVSSSITHDGSANVLTALVNFINANKGPGVEITLQPNSIYRVDGPLFFQGVNDIHIDLNGSEVFSTVTTGASNSGRVFSFRDCDHISITNGVIRGSHPDPGEFQFGPEHGHGIGVDAGSDHRYTFLEIYEVRGDGFYFDHWNAEHVDGIVIEDCLVSDNGRMGIAVCAARNLVARRMRFHNIAWSPLDVEPEYTGNFVGTSQGADNIQFLGGTCTGWIGAGPDVPAGAQFAYVGTPTTNGGSIAPVVRNITISDYTVASTAQRGMWTKFDPLGYRISNVSIARVVSNTGPVSTPFLGWPVWFTNVDGGTATNNHQNMDAATTFTRRVNSTGITSSGNTGTNITGQ